MKEQEFKIYPNPTSDKLAIVTLNGDVSDFIIEVYDLHGRLIQNLKTTSLSTMLDLSPFPSGAYFIKMGNEQTFQIEKVIKI